MGKRHSSTRFDTARAAWLADARFRRLSPVTIREYGRISGALLAHLATEVGRAPTLDDLRPALVRTWLNDRRPPLQPASVAAYVRSLRAFAGWCGREYKVSNPLAGLQPPRVEPPPVPVFSPDQLRQASHAYLGPPAEDVLEPVPHDDLVRATLDAIPTLVADLEDDTRNVLLTLARMWTTTATRAIRSKDDDCLSIVAPRSRQHGSDGSTDGNARPLGQ